MLNIMNPLDRKLVSVLKMLRKGAAYGAKQMKARTAFRGLRSRVADADLGRQLDDLFGDLATPPAQRRKLDVEETIRILQVLRRFGFAETIALLFEQWGAVLASLDLEGILPLCVNAGCLEAWRKTVSVPAKELESRLLAEPARAYATAGADWLLLHAKADQLIPVLDCFLSRKARPKHLVTWAGALAVALKNDKRGMLLDAILRHPWPGENHVAALAEVVRLNRPVLRQTVDLLPRILAKEDAPKSAVRFVDDVFGMLVTTDIDEREFKTAALARLGTGILMAERRGPQLQEALKIVEKTARLLRNLTEDEIVSARTWVLENLAQEKVVPEGRLQVTLDGARDLAAAFEKLGQGFPADEVLRATARNLGLTPVGVEGDSVEYNPLRHEDMVGGMLPGDPAIIETPGWAHGDEVVARAKVKKGRSHV